jgi:drug/metabolite transporter (DMT)-like permease
VKVKDTILFILLGLLWGQTFLWIKIGVEGLSVFVFVALRIALALVFLGVILLVRKPKTPRGWREWGTLAVIGLLNNAVPFTLVAWGEQQIDSAIAAILHSMIPLLTMLIAHFTLADDRMDFKRASGLTFGFLGVIVILLQDLGNASFASNLIRQGAVLVAALSYAVAAVFIRRNARHISPTVQAFYPLVIADIFTWSVALSVDTPVQWPQGGLAWFAIIYLGFVASGTGYLVYYSLIQSIGPTKTTLVTYIFPVVGVILGVVFLGETLVWNTVVGGIMVIFGIVVVNWKGSPVVESVKTKTLQPSEVVSNAGSCDH